jgi:hypothetical protein
MLSSLLHDSLNLKYSFAEFVSPWLAGFSSAVTWTMQLDVRIFASLTRRINQLVAGFRDHANISLLQFSELFHLNPMHSFA